MKNSIENLAKSSKLKIVTISVVSLLAGIAIVAALFHMNAQAATETFMQSFDEGRGMVAQGTIQASEVSINSKLPGRVISVSVVEGQTVKKGDPLFEISSDELQAKKEQAEAAIAQAKAGLAAAEGQQTQAQAGIDASKALVAQANAGVEASKALVQQVQAGVQAASGKVAEAQAGYDASIQQQVAAQSVNDKAENGARAQEIAQAQAYYDLMKSSYDRVAALEQKGAVSKQKLDEVRTQMEIAEQTLSLAKEGARIEDKTAASAVNEQAKVGITASQTRIDQATAGLDAVRAQLTQAMAGEQAAIAQLSQATAGLQASTSVYNQVQSAVELRKAQIDQAQGALNEVLAYLKDTVILAPSDGTVTVVNSNEGELVSSGMSMATVSNVAQPWIEVNVKETEIENVREGQKVEVKFPAYGHKIFNGTVAVINKQPDFAVKRATTENGDFDIVSYKVKIQMDTTNEDVLYAGLTSYVQFLK